MRDLEGCIRDPKKFIGDPRFLSSTLLPFLVWGLLIKPNSREKGTLIIKGLLRNLVPSQDISRVPTYPKPSTPKPQNMAKRDHVPVYYTICLQEVPIWVFWGQKVSCLGISEN